MQPDNAENAEFVVSAFIEPVANRLERPSMPDLRRRTWEILEAAKPGDLLSRGFDWALMALVILNVLAAIVGAVREVREGYGLALEAFEVVSVVLFTAEYLARVWSCVSQAEYARPVAGRR